MGEGQIELQQVLQEMRFWKVKRLYMIQKVREVQGAEAQQVREEEVQLALHLVKEGEDHQVVEAQQTVHRVMVVQQVVHRVLVGQQLVHRVLVVLQLLLLGAGLVSLVFNNYFIVLCIVNHIAKKQRRYAWTIN